MSKTKVISLESFDARIGSLEYKVDRLEASIEQLSSEVRKIGFLHEDLDTKFRLLMEGFGALDRKMERLELHVAEKFAEIDYKFEVVFTRFDELDATLAKKLDREEFISFQTRFA